MGREMRGRYIPWPLVKHKPLATSGASSSLTSSYISCVHPMGLACFCSSRHFCSMYMLYYIYWYLNVCTNYSPDVGSFSATNLCPFYTCPIIYTCTCVQYICKCIIVQVYWYAPTCIPLNDYACTSTCTCTCVYAWNGIPLNSLSIIL